MEEVSRAMMMNVNVAGEYHSKDFEWETLKHQIEQDPSLEYHLLPFDVLQYEHETPEQDDDADAWRSFHSRHSSGKFFKVSHFSSLYLIV